ERGFTEEGGDVGRLTHPSERALILKMIRMEEVVEIVSSRLEPHHLAHYALELASAFTKFYDDCRVLPSEMQPVEPETTCARLLLVRAAKQVLARTLSLMGVTAPESM
ncbi:MAG TPA: DALR anticodon-binding domain-containing protein, partial [Anaerolineae bacterium]